MTRALAKIVLAVGVCVLLAFGYAALKYGGKQEQKPESVQTPAPPPAPEPELPSPAPKPQQTPVPKPLEKAEAQPSVEAKESSNASDAPLDPDATAWEKVEHIRNNLHLYGTFHPDADAIIAQLNSPPENFLNPKTGVTEGGEFIHEEEGHDLVFDLFDQLIPLNDPRAAELLVRYRYEYGAGSVAWSRALVNLGAPSIPFLLEHVKMRNGTSRLSVIEILKEIVDRHPDLDSDIATDILEPLFEKNKRWLQKMGLL